jgi:hypothetical protein
MARNEAGWASSSGVSLVRVLPLERRAAATGLRQPVGSQSGLRRRQGQTGIDVEARQRPALARQMPNHGSQELLVVPPRLLVVGEVVGQNRQRELGRASAALIAPVEPGGRPLPERAAGIEGPAVDVDEGSAVGLTNARVDALLQYIPPPGGIPPPMPPLSGFSLGISHTMASVVSRSAATEAAFCRADRTTLDGSMTPASTRFS